MGTVCASFHVPQNLKAGETTVRMHPEGVFLVPIPPRRAMYICVTIKSISSVIRKPKPIKRQACLPGKVFLCEKPKGSLDVPN